MHRRSSYDLEGNIRPLRQRNPVAFWMAIIMVAAMLATGFTAIAAVLYN